MVRKLEHQWRSWWKSPYFVIKLGVLVLLVGVAFVLIYNRSSDSSIVSTTPFLENTISLAPQETSDQIPSKEDGTKSIDSEVKCNLFIGEWVADKAKPLYTNNSCRFIEEHQNCMKNGRPDSDYLYWRWNPQGCVS